MYDLNTFSLDDMMSFCAALRALGDGASGMNEVAARIVRQIYDELARPPDGARCSALVRYYQTMQLADMDEPRRSFAARAAGEARLAPETPCLALLASVGDEPSWNDPARSAGHFAIPLPDAQAVSKMPMITRLWAQLGIPTSSVLCPDPGQFTEWAERTYGVFHVEHAEQSPDVPAQAGFVDRYGIRSVIGFGGVLPNGRMFAVLLFSKVRVGAETAALFRPLALAVKLAVLPFVFGAGERQQGKAEEVVTCNP